MTAKKDKLQVKIDREKAARIQFVKNAIDFIRFSVDEQGTLVSRTISFSHTHTIRALHNFHNFSFLVDIGQTMLGGNEIKVWYHPGVQYEKKLTPVLSVWWQSDIEKCRLDTFDPDQRWQGVLLKIIGHLGKAAVGAHKVVPVKRVLTVYEEELRQQHLARREKGEYAL